MLGKNIRALRLNKNMTIGEVASQLEMQLSALSKYERDEREPDYLTIIKIADYFSVSVDWLLGRTTNPREYSKSDIDFTTLLKYNAIIKNARNRFLESGVTNEDEFADLLDIIVRNGFDSAIEILRIRREK